MFKALWKEHFSFFFLAFLEVLCFLEHFSVPRPKKKKKKLVAMVFFCRTCWFKRVASMLISALVSVVVAENEFDPANLAPHFIAIFACRVNRHSKSLHITANKCGCGGSFQLLVNKVNKKGETVRTPHSPRPPNKFALFVKENYGSVKKSAKGLKHKDIMAQLSKDFAQTKLQ